MEVYIYIYLHILQRQIGVERDNQEKRLDEFVEYNTLDEFVEYNTLAGNQQ